MSKVIYSTEDNALEQLRERLEKQRAEHEEMKKRNAYFRKHNTMVGYPDMKEETALKINEKIANGYSWERQPYPTYTIQNSNQRIKATEQRIKKLEAEQNREESVYDTNGLGFEVVENTDLKRLQLIFSGDGRVDEKTYKTLRVYGFVYSRQNGAFQRLLNEKSRYVARLFIEEQRALQKKAEAEM